VETFQTDLELMVTALFDLAVQSAKIMSASGRGAIVNLSSISGFQGARSIAGYASAKHAVIGLTRSLANEFAPLGINVNCLAPGIFETEMANNVTQDPAKRKEMLGRVPAGRFGEPNDIVGPLLFLISPAARHVHGTTLVVDGGWLGR
jgi:2-deoxy-D-gluconate 3-dehydrogenase